MSFSIAASSSSSWLIQKVIAVHFLPALAVRQMR